MTANPDAYFLVNVTSPLVLKLVALAVRNLEFGTSYGTLVIRATLRLADHEFGPSFCIQPRVIACLFTRRTLKQTWPIWCRNWSNHFLQRLRATFATISDTLESILNDWCQSAYIDTHFGLCG